MKYNKEFGDVFGKITNDESVKLSYNGIQFFYELRFEMSKLVMPKNTLKEKVGNGGFKNEDLLRAQTAIDENDVDFKPIADKYLGLIRVGLEDYKNNNAHDLYSILLDQLMQLRAQGSLFRYPSITAISDTVVDLLDSIKKVDGTIIEIVQAYEQSTKILMAHNIKSSDDKTCVALVKELAKVCQKYKDKHQQ